MEQPSKPPKTKSPKTKSPKTKSPKTLREIREVIARLPAASAVENEILNCYRDALPSLVQALEEETSPIFKRRGIMIQDLLERLRATALQVRPNAVRAVLREMGYRPRQTNVPGTTLVRASLWIKMEEDPDESNVPSLLGD